MSKETSPEGTSSGKDGMSARNAFDNHEKRKDWYSTGVDPTNHALDKLRAWCAAHYVPPEDPTVQCPFCYHQVPEKWQQMVVITNGDGTATEEPYEWIHSTIPNDKARNLYVSVQWMTCHNDECGQIIVQINRKLTTRMLSRESVLGLIELPKSLHTLDGKTIKPESPIKADETWLAVPKRKTPFIHPLITGSYARDFKEAWAIVDDSHRMSAVLARKILQDLLAEFAALKNWSLDGAIEVFINDASRPLRLRQNMDYLRVLANMGAHTKTNKLGDVLEASKEEVEWTLKIVADLFEYFIVEPAKDKEVRDNLNARIEAAGKPGMRAKNPRDLA